MNGDKFSDIRAARKVGVEGLEKVAKRSAHRMIAETRNYESMLSKLNSRRVISDEVDQK